ncbi:CACTA en-spm transposon protein [Cucumis melo var. makuwa]|uniref:CACTA en-spm transposon protein n=1 Tax=Cucumis melo var. makuwa TaxID=1194695 RepID=A0A5D3DJQ5_CUCMM|nr:CACTA en-spm transposon protein [Cucumis melo var. makuwa]
MYWKSLSDIVWMNTLRMTPCTMSFTNGFNETDALFYFATDMFNNAGGTSSMSDTSGVDKPISPHVVRFSNTIGVLTQDTFSVRFIKWAYVTSDYIEVVKGNLRHELTENEVNQSTMWSCLEKHTLGVANLFRKLPQMRITPVSTYLEDSQPLSKDKICEAVLGRRSDYSKGLGWVPGQSPERLLEVLHLHHMSKRCMPRKLVPSKLTLTALNN